jgi:hypothetical protein
MIGLTGSNIALLGASGIDPDAARWIATVGQANVSGPRGRMVSDTIRELKAGGVWADLDFLPVLCAENTAQALVDWKARKTMTLINTPTFTADRGYAFSTSGLNTGFVPSTDAVRATGTSFMAGSYERTNVADGNRTMGAYASPTLNVLVLPRNASNGTAFQMNTNALITATGVTDSRGLTVAVTDGANATGYKNGAAALTVAATSAGTSLINLALFIGGYNSAGSLTSPRASTLGYCMFGRNAWTATQHATFYDVMQRFMTKLGANV